MSNKKYDRKHLQGSQRLLIEKGLNDNESFAAIGRKIGKDPSTVSKEIRRHITYHVTRDMNRDIPCAMRTNCMARNLCGKNCTYPCKICRNPAHRCTAICKDYIARTCVKLKKPPYVCNGCQKRNSCLLKKSFYSAQYAQDTYQELLTSSRAGINQSPVDVHMLDELISPLLKKGQSLAHIYANHASEIPCCRRTLYNYIDRGVFVARNIDMRRRVRYKVRKKPTKVSLLAREFRVGRTYEDYQKLIKNKPDISIVQMDTVEGTKKNGDQVFLTMLFCNCSLMLIFLLNDKTSESVIKVFDWLERHLGIETFREIFELILTDNGTEFQQPERLECNSFGELRTRIFYCNPHSSWQKGMIERNHGYIRLVIPKGNSFSGLTSENITLLMNHINSEARDRLNSCTPYKLSRMLLNNKLHTVMQLKEILPDDVMLKPELLK